MKFIVLSFKKGNQSYSFRSVHKTITLLISQIIRNYNFQSVNYVIKHCLTNGIGKIVIGELLDIKRGTNLGKRTNQHFQAIPFGKFKQQLELRCKYYGITYTEVNEAYTSQTCAQCGIQRKANRKKRGLYSCNSLASRLLIFFKFCLSLIL